MQIHRTAFITGITGQDGLYLARYLLEKGYNVHGMRLYEAAPDSIQLQRLNADYPDCFRLHYGDMTDEVCLLRLVTTIQPDEIYNLAALSHVRVSFDLPVSTMQINGMGPLYLLEAMKALNKPARFYQASSSEMYGNAPAPQNEETHFQPCSPYATAKLSAYWHVRNYRDSYGLHASNGILFNHESPLRGHEFVTRKITRGIAAIVRGQLKTLMLGNLEAQRDWGHARDYVDGMWRMVQADQPGDYVLASGKTRSVRAFVETAFSYAGMSLVWEGQGLAEKGVCRRTGRTVIAIDPGLFRPSEVHCLRGDASKARQELGWIPSISFKQLVQEMVEADLHDVSVNDAAGNDDVFAAE